MLVFHASRPTLHGLEGHLAVMHRAIREAQPQAVVVDPIGTFLAVSAATDVKALLVRLMDSLKERHVTALFTSLTAASGASLEETNVGISSLIDTWLLLRDFETSGERNRGLYVLKSRGMAHSNQVREFLLTEHGIELVDVCIGPEGVLVGSARRARQAHDELNAMEQDQEIERRRRELELKRQVLEARIAALRSEFRMEEERHERLLGDEGRHRERLAEDRQEMARSRQADHAGGHDGLARQEAER